MKMVARMALTPGMILGEDVRDTNGKIILKKESSLTQNDIDLIKRCSIMCVSIMEEIDFADTHYEKLQYDDTFRAFQICYGDSLSRYKKMMLDFLQRGVFIENNKLLPIVTNLRGFCKTEKQVLDYLFNLMPNEDLFTYSHLLNSAIIASVFANWLSFPAEERDLLIECAFFYDIGKVYLPDWLLWKTGKLSPEESTLLQKHTLLGYQALCNTPLQDAIKASILQHHERIDGTGYPRQLKGDAIDKYSRILSIIDTYEAMASPRTYRASSHPFNIIREFEKNVHLYDSQYLFPIINHLAESLIGSEVQLNDHQFYEILILNKNQLSRPYVRGKNQEIINLAQHPEINII